MESLFVPETSKSTVETFIVLDTNIFAEKTRLLKTGVGPSLIYVASLKKAKIVMPDVVRSETTRYALNAVSKLWKEIADGFRQVREYMDESLDPSAPTQEVIFKAVNERFDTLKRWMVPIPMTDELLKRAANRVLQKIPPSHDDDAFKDALLWESVLTLPEGCSVYFAAMTPGLSSRRRRTKNFSSHCMRKRRHAK